MTLRNDAVTERDRHSVRRRLSSQLQTHSSGAEMNYSLYQPLPVLPALPMGHQPRPHKCPICHGTGQVAHSFYDPPTPGTSAPTINARVTCRGCGGRGVIVA